MPAVRKRDLWSKHVSFEPGMKEWRSGGWWTRTGEKENDGTLEMTDQQEWVCLLRLYDRGSTHHRGITAM